MSFLEEPPQGGRAADFHTWHSGRHDWSGMQRSMGRAGVARAGIDSAWRAGLDTDDSRSVSSEEVGVAQFRFRYRRRLDDMNSGDETGGPLLNAGSFKAYRSWLARHSYITYIHWHYQHANDVWRCYVTPQACSSATCPRQISSAMGCGGDCCCLSFELRVGLTNQRWALFFLKCLLSAEKSRRSFASFFVQAEGSSI